MACLLLSRNISALLLHYFWSGRADSQRVKPRSSSIVSVKVCLDATVLLLVLEAVIQGVSPQPPSIFAPRGQGLLWSYYTDFSVGNGLSWGQSTASYGFLVSCCQGTFWPYSYTVLEWAGGQPRA